MTQSEELASLPLEGRIAALIEKAGTNQEGLAEILGTPRETVNRWLNHHARPGRENRQKLAELATNVYGEAISPDLFRSWVTDRRTPLEVAAAQLAQTARSIEEALTALTQIASEVVPLLERQEALVLEMQTFVAELRHRKASNEDVGGSR